MIYGPYQRPQRVEKHRNQLKKNQTNYLEFIVEFSSAVVGGKAGLAQQSAVAGSKKYLAQPKVVLMTN